MSNEIEQLRSDIRRHQEKVAELQQALVSARSLLADMIRERDHFRERSETSLRAVEAAQLRAEEAEKKPERWKGIPT